MVEQRLVLRAAKLANNNGCLANSWWAVVGCVACRRRTQAERVEAVAVEVCFDNGAGARVDVFGHAVEVEFPDEFVCPSVVGDVEDFRLPASGIANRGALVAWGSEVVFPSRQRGQVLPVLHAGPNNKDVGVCGVDGVGAGGHVADECLPVVVEVGFVPGLAKLVAQRHADDVGVRLGPFGDIGEAAAPVCSVEVEVVEPSVSVDVGAAPLSFSDVDVWADEDALGSRNASNIAPNLKPRGLAGPPRVLLDNFLGHFGAVDISKCMDHSNFKRYIFSITIVDLVDHFDGVAHADIVEAHAADVV
jgi:hypothetical protein